MIVATAEGKCSKNAISNRSMWMLYKPTGRRNPACGFFIWLLYKGMHESGA